MATRKQDFGAVSGRRLHISGLHSSIQAQEICDRFSSFGTVLNGATGVTGLGLDANGYPKTYAFLTLEATDAQLARCTSLLSGSMWKGHKLRIANAKPDYHTRMQAERDQNAADLAAGKITIISKKRKRNPDPLVGEASKKFELVTVENIKRHRGWNLETTTNTPLFALLCRPTHPLDLPPKAAPTAWTREAPKSKASKAARAILKAAKGGMGVLGIKPTTRSRRVKIDVRRWGRKKLIFGLDGAGKPRKDGWWSGTRVGEWECVEGDDTTKVDQVEWVFRANDGTIKRTESVQLTARSVPHTDSFAALLNKIDASALSTMPPPIIDEPAPNLPIISLPITFAPPSTSAASPIIITNRPRSLSPPPYVPTATKALMYNEEDTFALLTATQDAAAHSEYRQQELDVGLMVLRSLLGPSETKIEGESVNSEKKLPMVEGFGAESSDEDEVTPTATVLRLRGGASEEDEDSESESEEITEIEKEKTTLHMGSLKDMFKPQEEAEPFSMFSSFGLDLPAAERTPSPEPFSYATTTTQLYTSTSFVPPTALGGKNRSWIGTASVGAFFLYPSSTYNGDIVDESVPEIRREAAARETTERISSANNFWRNESLEKIEASHAKLQESLRGQARKRHREAAKRVRRKGTNKRGTGGGAGAMTEDLD